MITVPLIRVYLTVSLAILLRLQGEVLFIARWEWSLFVKEKLYKAGVKPRCTSHQPNQMLMRENKGFFSFAFDSAHVNDSVRPGSNCHL